MRWLLLALLLLALLLLILGDAPNKPSGAAATHAADNTSMATAVCALHPMSKGLHRADFRVVQCSGAVGLVKASLLASH
jgi:hypothetical protein